jgi:hypothetical protein
MWDLYEPISLFKKPLFDSFFTSFRATLQAYLFKYVLQSGSKICEKILQKSVFLRVCLQIEMAYIRDYFCPSCISVQGGYINSIYPPCTLMQLGQKELEYKSFEFVDTL